MIPRRFSNAVSAVARAALTGLLIQSTSAIATTQVWSAATLPADGAIEGAPGQRIGWGYVIHNLDPFDWLVITDLFAPGLQLATPDIPFDFPILAPGATVSVPFSATNGLFAMTWGSDAPAGFSDVGTFVMYSVFWNGDPLNGGGIDSTLNRVELPFSATVSAIIEPSRASFLLLGIGSLVLLRHRKPEHFKRSALHTQVPPLLGG